MNTLQSKMNTAINALEVFEKSVSDLEPSIRELFLQLNTQSIRLPFPISFSGGDYHDEYERLVVDSDGFLQLEDSGNNATDVGNLDVLTVFSAYQQVINNYAS